MNKGQMKGRMDESAGRGKERASSLSDERQADRESRMQPPGENRGKASKEEIKARVREILDSRNRR